jgi:hypothetical protein
MRLLALNSSDLLRGDETNAAAHRHWLARLLLNLLLFGMIYGGTMGLFGGLGKERALQPLFSAIKVPLLLLVTFAVSLPSFFVLNTVAGLRDDFGHVIRALLATQAGLTIVLASLAPLTAFWYVCLPAYDAALTFNAMMFGIASFAGQYMLRRAYQPLIARDPRHRTMLRLWLVIYVFVGIQMAWVLRPFVGQPGSPTRFFRAEAWGNAYVELVHIVARALRL